MNFSLFFRTDAMVLCLLLFAACILTVMAGRYTRIRLFHHDQQESKGGVTSLLGALFGLWGFLLAFTFSNSATKFESVRLVMLDESNIIRNSFARADFFPDSIRNGMREDLTIYLDALIRFYESAGDYNKMLEEKAIGDEAGKRLLAKTIDATKLPGMTMPGANMFATLTTMLDLNARRNALLLGGVPEPVVYMLFFLAVAISFIGGFTTPIIKAKEWIIVCGFLLLACLIIYITIDLGRPLRGSMHPNTGKAALIELRKKI